MGFLKKIFDLYIFSNIHVAFAGFCITKVTLLKYGIIENVIPFFVAFSIVVSYNFIRFYEIKKKRLIWLKNWFLSNSFFVLFVSAISVIGILIIAFKMTLTLKTILILTFFSFMTLFYVIPIFKRKKLEYSFRNFPFIKIYSIAIAWAGVSVLFSLSAYNIQFNKGVYLEFIQRFLILIAIIIPFEIRDLTFDNDELKTIPQLIGIKKAKILGFILLIIFVLLEFLKEQVLLKNTLLISLITVGFLIFSSSKRNRYYAAFWVESIPIFWLLILMYF